MEHSRCPIHSPWPGLVCPHIRRPIPCRAPGASTACCSSTGNAPRGTPPASVRSSLRTVSPFPSWPPTFGPRPEPDGAACCERVCTTLCPYVPADESHPAPAHLPHILPKSRKVPLLPLLLHLYQCMSRPPPGRVFPKKCPVLWVQMLAAHPRAPAVMLSGRRPRGRG